MVKINRSYPAPASLAKEARKSNGSYNKKDVTERLRADFFDKCYICELKGLQDPVVEHLLPHKNGQYPERKFDWDNLFWCCGHCNEIKNKDEYEQGIIDCCRQDPEKLLHFRVQEDDIQVNAVSENDQQARLTAKLIYETFNKRNTGIREAACDQRMHELLKSMDVLYRELEKYKNKPTSVRNKRMIAALLRKDSAFAAFKRGYVRDRYEEYPELKELVGQIPITSTLLDCLKKHGNKAPIMITSSVQATLSGRFGDSEYERSKLAGEELMFKYGEETGAPVYVYRFENMVGKQIRPRYNSAVATFCYCISRGEPITVNDPSVLMEVVFFDDICEEIYDAMEGHPHRCHYEGVEAVPDENGRYCHCPVKHKATLGEIVNLLHQFHDFPADFIMPKLEAGAFHVFAIIK